MLKVVAWNIVRRVEAWRCLADSDADIALLQEAAEPPADIASRFDVDPAPWRTAGAGLNRRWRAAVVKLSDRVTVEWLDAKAMDDAGPCELVVSRTGTLAAGVVTPTGGQPLIVASMYAPWEKPHSRTASRWIYADASVHRVISDLSVLIGQERHRIVAAGDLNSLFGYGEYGSAYWASRHGTVFSRMSALGFSFVGPQAPAGRRAGPWPAELPRSSNNVPTYYTNRQTPCSGHPTTRFRVCFY